MRMERWREMMFPVRRVCGRLASRLGFRKTGLLKLRRDVRKCEYEDVHAMWEMLKKNEAGLARSPRKYRRRAGWNFFGWARCAPSFPRSY